MAGEGFTYLVQRGNLFHGTAEYSLCHSVSKDFVMGAGIARQFRDLFGRVIELKSMGRNIGEVAALEDNGRFLYYLVTKNKYHGKPSYGTIRASLVDMRKHAILHGVTTIAMCKIGSGLDQMDWKIIERIILDVFRNSRMTIIVRCL